MATSATPIALLLGQIDHANSEWDELSALAQLRQINEGTREQFLKDCSAGKHDGVFAIYRTFDSVKFTGRFDPELVEVLPSSLKFISHNGAGYDQIDAKACIARGIGVSNTPKAVDASTADTAMFLLLGALRHIHTPYVAIRAGQWRGGMKLGHDAEGKTLGILGMGGIGNTVAKRAKAFDLKIQYHNRQPLPHGENPTNATFVSLEDLLQTSDILSVHLPLSNSTRHFLGEKQFDMMKDGIIIINTARGPIIDEEVLVKRLESGKVYAAGLDVYEHEPKVHEGLIKSDKVVILPHVGTATVETQYKMESLVVRNVRSALENGELITPVPEMNGKA